MESLDEKDKRQIHQLLDTFIKNSQLKQKICFGLTKGEQQMQTANIKQEAQRLLNNLPEDATWDDIMYQIYVHQTIETGLKESDDGHVVDVKEVRKIFGLAE